MGLGRILKKILKRKEYEHTMILDAADAANNSPPTSMLAYAIFVFVLFRVAQRAYYLLRGHRHLFAFDPSSELEALFQRQGVVVTDHSFQSPKDGVLIKYRRIGTGKRLFLLANGVGTALYMWLPIFWFLFKIKPAFFQGDTGITLIAPVYRGLFGSNATEESKRMCKGGATAKRSAESVTDPAYAEEVDITMNNCADDMVDVLQHVKEHEPSCSSSADGHNNSSDNNTQEGDSDASSSPWKDAGEEHYYYEMVIGWSMGAQCILTCLEKHPFIAKKLFLLNPSSGRSLHTTFQPFMPLPFSVTSQISQVLRFAIIKVLRPVIRTAVWDVLKSFSDSIVMRILLEISSFWGGFPPEQGGYFHSYLLDVFSTREQTRGLLDLIIALDSPLQSVDGGSGGYGHFKSQKSAFGGKSEQSMVVSGLPDIMTGIYHANIIAGNMSHRCSHKTYTMASHFLLMEWPDMVAADILELADNGYDSFFRRGRLNDTCSSSSSSSSSSSAGATKRGR
jgi:hypothetical protein